MHQRSEQAGIGMEIGLVVAHGGETFVGDTLDDVITQWRGTGVTDVSADGSDTVITIEEIEEIRKILDRLEAKLQAEKAE